MNKFFTKLYLIICVILSLTLSCSIKSQFTKANPDIMKKVNEILSKMTLEEKAGQLTQLSASLMFKGNKILTNKIHELIVKYKIGTFLYGGDSLVHPNKPESWAKVNNIIQSYTEKTRLKIPVIIGVDAVHGHTHLKGSVIYPHNIGIAATWNTNLAYKSALLTSEEVAESGMNWNFSPVLDVLSDPRWPRNYETFGEDPYLVSKMGRSMILGIQKSGRVAACAKHFIGYSASNNGKDREPASISERALREIFLPPFISAIKSGVDTFMINSGGINGVPAHASKYIMNKLLRKELNFQGLIISDWKDVYRLFRIHKVAKSLPDAVARAYNSGIEINMTPFRLPSAIILRDILKKGKIPITKINNAVRRMLYLKFKLNLFKNRYASGKKLKNLINNEASRKTAKALALQSMTLLNNENNILPISKKIKNILITGPAAVSKSRLCGGWTIKWQGAWERNLVLGKTVLDSIKNKVSKSTKIKYLSQYTDPQKLINSAKKADVCIAVVGEKPYAEMKGNTDRLVLPLKQRNLLKTLKKSGKPVIMVVVAGRPLLINWEAYNLEGILWAYLPGSAGGEAIADVLFGDYNPSGRLPFTIPKNAGQLPKTYNCLHTRVYKPLYPFGYGKSYTEFKYSNLKIPSRVKIGRPIKLSLTVKNTGRRSGNHTVLLYYKNKTASVTPRRKQICGFKRIHLKPNQDKQVVFIIKPEQLKILNEDMILVDEEREIEVETGKLTSSVIIHR